MEPVWPSSFKAYGFSVQPVKEVTGACFPFLSLTSLLESTSFGYKLNVKNERKKKTVS